MGATTNRKLRAAILKKLDVTPQRLYQLVKARKAEHPMSTPLAIYTIAHEEGIDISKYLDDDTTREVGAIVAGLRGNGQSTHATASRPRTQSAAAKEVKVTIAGVDAGKIPVLEPAHAANAKRMSERVYPTLYIFENSVRDLIERVLEAKHGKEWWTKAAPPKVQATAKKHMAAEKKDPWHSARGTRPIDFVFLNELWAVMNHNWREFKNFFTSKAWIESLITNDMNVSRRVLAHMNPLPADDIKNIEAAFRKWIKQLRAIEGDLP